jgi:hypothetical protein
LDQLTRNYIREHLGYRFAIHADGTGPTPSSARFAAVPCQPDVHT